MADAKTTPRMNRTGVSVAPEEARKTVEGARQAGPSSKGDAQAIAQMRKLYIVQRERIGSPPPSRAVSAVFMDKLGDRLAFERGGTRLYEAMLGKVRAIGAEPGGPAEADLQHIMAEELEHFELVQAAIEGLGGDPTFETPSANLSGVASLGIVQIVSDARTTVAESLGALLIAELTDNDAWQMLIELAQALGQTELASEFQAALEQEREHLEMVRGWVKAMALTNAGVKR
jgi:rubrerythrin